MLPLRSCGTSPSARRRSSEGFPLAFEWLRANEEQLRGRTEAAALGQRNDENWILFSRRQNLERFPEPKVLVPT